MIRRSLLNAAGALRRVVLGAGRSEPTASVFNVESRGQQGGVTAGQVIFGTQDRTLGPIPPGVRQQLQSRPVSLMLVLNNADGETRRLARQIEGLLSELGWPSPGLPAVVTGAEIVNGLAVHSVAAASEVDVPLRAFAEGLRQAGLALAFVHSAPSDAIVLGPQQ